MGSVRRCAALRICILTLVLIASARGGESTPPAAIEWIRQHAIPLKTVEAGNGFQDMMPLKNIIGDARVVQLGEATHGTREFFQLKHRMVEFLASKMGFTIFSIEANMPEAYRLNDYVLHGKGDPKALLKGMYFWTWDTEEVLAMIEWMRAFNRSGKGRIEFTGFDMQTPTVAMEIVRQYVAQHDNAYLASLNGVWDQVRKVRPQGGFGPFGVATATFPAATAAGKTVTFSGYIKTENITRGYAGLWWRVDGEPGKTLAFDNMANRGPRGTTPWTRYEIKLQVPPDARNINFGVLHPGDGTAWFDSLQVELDGKPYTDSSAFDLSFESPAARGFYVGGSGYRVEITNQTAQSGKQSLRSQYIGGAENAADGKLVAVACRAVLDHLELQRARFAKDEAVLADWEWAQQNARVVLQSVEMNTGERSRDRSMADNIKWIADRNPKAKIVVWAHNGHIAYGGYALLDSMGGHLRKMFGSHIVSFGFAFDQGGFRAVEPGKSLRDFTVGPAPEGSLDHALAATGFPVLALDLRTVPSTGAAADWVRAPHPSRSIGAVYSADYAIQYFLPTQATQMYDALLFVAQTTPARQVTISAPQARPPGS